MNPTLEILCDGPAATQAVAAAIARILLPGDVLFLDGDLGAGKTTFTQGLARAMGVEEPVTSPTFALVRSYPTAFGIELIHADVYRLDHLADIVALGLPEMIDDGAVAVIEWGERAGPAVGAERLHVHLSLTDVEGERRLSLVPAGTRWLARWDDLSSALAHHEVGRR
ncbi:MAG TPA: tRNA (adenosine(37)-N6)-threonylcarbamoyltransferase complex ATPase subunit type 1 TsaE [Acidimicrobiales bacterium]|jgi:tRNA threonylcarbamoyladenosine biosynthesis protein TsaE